MGPGSGGEGGTLEAHAPRARRDVVQVDLFGVRGADVALRAPGGVAWRLDEMATATRKAAADHAGGEPDQAGRVPGMLGRHLNDLRADGLVEQLELPGGLGRRRVEGRKRHRAAPLQGQAVAGRRLTPLPVAREFAVIGRSMAVGVPG